MKKSLQISESLPLALLLTISGGFMDAYSYMARDHVFANAQTGNILLFGVSLSTGEFAVALRYLVPVCMFALGIAAAEVVRTCYQNRKRVHWRQITLLAEVLMLFAVAFLPQRMNLLANSMISFACGAQVESFRKVGGIKMATTMCIGNLRAAVSGICHYTLTRNRAAKERSLVYFALIFMFIAGAVLGNFCVRFLGDRAILVSAFLLLIGFFAMLINHEDSKSLKE